MDNVGFEYRSKEGETAFETFLKYSNEKEKSSAVLGRILDRLLIRNGMTFLDVGSGNGEFLRLALSRINHPQRVEFILLEPSQDLANQLRLITQHFPANSTVRIECSTFENLITNSQFDIILASHVPLAKDQSEKLPGIFERMLRLLKPDGSLIVVLRAKDDIHEFRTVFKSMLMGRDYRFVIIDDAVSILENFAQAIPLRISKFSAEAELRLPYPGSMRDVISIVEFFLNKKWEEFPDNIRQSVLEYIRQRKGVLRHIDGFVLAEKLPSSQTHLQ